MIDSASTLQSKLHGALQQLIEATAQNVKLRAENMASRKKLDAQQHTVDQSVNGSGTSVPPSFKKTAQREQIILSEKPSSFSKVEKGALFCSLFRGREDVYPVRWISPKLRSFYYAAWKTPTVFTWAYVAA